jgi:hypothetical protein
MSSRITASRATTPTPRTWRSRDGFGARDEVVEIDLSEVGDEFVGAAVAVLERARGDDHGTAGAFAPALLERLGVEVIPLDVEPDHSFPRYNPNPEDRSRSGEASTGRGPA